MKLFLYRLILPALLFTPFESLKAEEMTLNYRCHLPFWNAPAESTDGLFTGDLTLECEIPNTPNSKLDIPHLRKRIIDKIQLESIVHEGPRSEPTPSSPSLLWDVSHRFEEEGNSIQIRELIHLSLESSNQLKYQTQSKEIIASGMASYLRSVEFTMILTQNQNLLSVSFRNRVKVKRPWFALDLIFAPIARKICFKKINQVKDKFMPWMMAEIPVRQ